MPGIRIATDFNNAALPVNIPFSDRIKAIPSLQMWAQPDTRHVVAAAGKIATFNDVGGGVGTFVQATDANRALLTDNLIAGFQGGEFSRANLTRYTLAGVTFNPMVAYTLAVLVKPLVGSLSSGIMGTYASATVRSLLQFTATNVLRFAHGAAQVDFAASLNNWHYLIAAFDGVNKAKFMVDGVRAADVTIASGTGANNVLTFGDYGTSGVAAITAQIADGMVFSADLFATGEYTTIRDYFREVYGLA